MQTGSPDFRQFIEQVKAAVPIEEVVREHVPSLQARGNSLKGLCPFHNEKTPSFYVHPDQGFYHCFGCGAHGDALKFVQEIERIDFMLALEQLARRAGLEMPRLARRDADAEALQAKRLDQLRELCKWAAEFFVEQMRVHPRGGLARQYLRERGLSDEEIRGYGLGFAPPEFEALAQTALRRGWTGETLAEAGLVSRRDDGSFYDRFRDRIIFPIADRMGNLVAFAGRLIEKREDAPKYINSAETPIFHKSQVLYGMFAARDAIRDTGEVILLEGYMDWIAMHRHGLGNALAGMGTALTEDQARMIKRVARRATLLYDADAAGQKAMFRAAELLLRQGVQVRAAVLHDDHDPDTFLKAEGTQAMRDLLAAAPPALEWFIQVAGREHDLGSPRGKAEAVEYLAPLLLALPDPVEQEGYLSRTAGALGLRIETVEKAIRQRLPRPRPTLHPPGGAEEGGMPGPDEPIDRPTQTEQNLLFILIKAAERWDLMAAVDPEWFQNDTIRRVFLAIRESMRNVREGADPPSSLFDLLQEETECHWLSRTLLLPTERYDGKIDQFEADLAEALQLQIFKLNRQAAQRRVRRLIQAMQLIQGSAPLGQGELAEVHKIAQENVEAFATLMRTRPTGKS
jgi:DNA primase